MGDGSGLAEALLGLDGFRVLEVRRTDDLDRDHRRSRGLWGVWHTGRVPGPHGGGGARSGLLRASGPVGVLPSAAWRTEIVADHETRASNGPTEGLNLSVSG